MERDNLPDWQPLDLENADGEAILARSASAGDGPGFVAILTTAGARQGAWAARATTVLARAWARERGRVLLADLDLMEPQLHEELGVENGEGVSDAFLYGASIQRVARPVEGGFLFAPAGTVVPDPADVLTSPRWGPVAEAFARAGATLLVHLPAESEGVGSLLARSTDVVLLTRSGEESVVAFGEWGDRVRAVLGPPHGSKEDRAPDGGTGAPAVPAVPPDPDAAAFLDDPFAPPPARPSAEPSSDSDDFDHVAAPVAGAGAAARAPSGGAEDDAWGADEFDAPPAAARTPAGADTASSTAPAAPAQGGRRAGLLVLLVLLAVLGVLLAGWFGVIDLPGIPARDAGAEAEAAAVAAPAAPPIMGYSVELGAYEDVAVAEMQAEALAEQRGDLLFLVAPVDVGGTVFYRLLAGLAEDSAGAARVRESLGSTLTREDPESWTIRYTPMAFQIGAFATLEEARSQVAELAAMDLPAYVLQGPSDSSTPYRVYAGAFGNEPESAHMKATLDSLGFRRAPLARRLGHLPDTTE